MTDTSTYYSSCFDIAARLNVSWYCCCCFGCCFVCVCVLFAVYYVIPCTLRPYSAEYSLPNLMLLLSLAPHTTGRDHAAPKCVGNCVIVFLPISVRSDLKGCQPEWQSQTPFLIRYCSCIAEYCRLCRASTFCSADRISEIWQFHYVSPNGNVQQCDGFHLFLSRMEWHFLCLSPATETCYWAHNFPGKCQAHTMCAGWILKS